jgi:nitrogen fixation protein FixH
MTTLASNKQRAYELGARNEFPVIASDIIYEGAAVGIVAGTGHARPLVAGDLFAGFAEAIADNSAGAAAAIRVRVIEEGEIELAVSGAVITDVRQPVYATDDDTFQFSPVGGSFIGYVKRFVSAGIVVVEFDAQEIADPWRAYTVREAISGNKTLDIEDNGKLFVVTADALVVTMPAVATPVNCVIMNGGAFGTQAVNISPVAADKIQGPDLPGTDNKDLINTKATARRGDFVKLVTGDANGPIVAELRGTWATEA